MSRGPALRLSPVERFAQSNVVRLEEARLAALDRIDAELARLEVRRHHVSTSGPGLRGLIILAAPLATGQLPLLQEPHKHGEAAGSVLLRTSWESGLSTTAGARSAWQRRDGAGVAAIRRKWRRLRRRRGARARTKAGVDSPRGRVPVFARIETWRNIGGQRPGRASRSPR